MIVEPSITQQLEQIRNRDRLKANVWCEIETKGEDDEQDRDQGRYCPSRLRH